jgi:hypothetical protein
MRSKRRRTCCVKPFYACGVSCKKIIKMDFFDHAAENERHNYDVRRLMYNVGK